jgi:hypothetical protein
VSTGTAAPWCDSDRGAGRGVTVLAACFRERSALFALAIECCTTHSARFHALTVGSLVTACTGVRSRLRRSTGHQYLASLRSCSATHATVQYEIPDSGTQNT